MANGINFCKGCVHGAAFERAGVEPATLYVSISGMARALMDIVGLNVNAVDFQDEYGTSRSTMRVPNPAIDAPGSVKEAIRDCQAPLNDGGRCGATALLEQRFGG